MEDCTDRYYTRVIQMLTCLMKNSFHDRQLVLVNTARVLKFLESYTSRQTKLWKVLSKYHNLLDHFHDLKTTLQTEFELLKTVTSKMYKTYRRQFKPSKHISQYFWVTKLHYTPSWHILTNKYKYIVYTHINSLMQYSSMPWIMTQT